MLRREATIRAALVQYFTDVIYQDKKIAVDPNVYAKIPWTVLHMALENACDENDSIDTKIRILRNITRLNRGLLGFLISKNNAFTF